jgi:hypothetical protein
MRGVRVVAASAEIRIGNEGDVAAAGIALCRTTGSNCYDIRNGRMRVDCEATETDHSQDKNCSKNNPAAGYQKSIQHTHPPVCAASLSAPRVISCVISVRRLAQFPITIQFFELEIQI